MFIYVSLTFCSVAGWLSALKMAKIQNVVITATLSKKFDLKKLSEQFKDSKFNPSRFPALRLKFGKVAFLLFSSGKLVCTGSKSVEQGRQVTEELLQNLAHFSYWGIQMKAFRVQNIVASGNLGCKIRLDWLHSTRASLDFATDLRNLESV